MQFASDELVAAFGEQTGIECQTVVASSGKLTAQISEGAPYHVLLSADAAYPDRLFQNGHTTGQPRIYAHGQLALWVATNVGAASLQTLAMPTVAHIALPNPETAPYGRAAKQALQAAGLWEQLQPKLVWAESVAQANQYLSTGAAQAGFTAVSVLHTGALQTAGNWAVVDTNTYQPIAQAMVVLTDANGVHPHAQTFFDFMETPEARSILRDFGYSVRE